MRISKLRAALFVFVGFTTTMLVSGVIYLESEYFASFVKHLISERSPQKLGVIGDFSNLKLYFFPPGLGVANPRIKIEASNMTQIPLDAEIEAKELRVSFAPIQMFSGLLRVSEVQLTGGALQGTLYANLLPKNKPKAETEPVTWQDLFRLQIDGVKFKDTYINLKTILPGEGAPSLNSELVVKELQLHRGKVLGHEGFLSSAVVNAVRITPPKEWKQFPVREANQLQWNLEVSDQGVSLNPFSLDLSGVRAELNGTITGNILNSDEDPNIEVNVDATSNIGTFFSANLNNEDFDGDILARAKLHGKLKKFAETLKGQFSLVGTDVSWKTMKAAHIDAEGDLDLKDRFVRLKRAEVQDQGTGDDVGKILVGETHIPLKFDSSIDTSLEFKNADIHWVGGLATKAVYPLEAKISGKLDAEFDPQNTDWELNVKPNLVVDQFGLTNLRMNERKVKRYILHPALPVKIQGEIAISPDTIDFSGTEVSLAETELTLDGGLNPKDGFDLKAQGIVSLKEIKEIAGNEIRGDGSLAMRVRASGKNLTLDFDPDIKDSSYLGLELGAIKGKIIFDDDLDEVRFLNMEGQYKGTSFSLSDGFVEVGGKDEIHLPIVVKAGRVEEMAEILTPIIKKVSWYPHSLKGELHGKVEVGGKVSNSDLKVNALVEGADWAWFGEKARRMKFNFEYDHENIAAKKVKLTKLNGSILGDISYSNTGELDWGFHTENFSLTDLDFMDRLEIPVRSKIEVSSSGTGPINHLKSKSDGRMFETEIKGEALENSHASIEVGESTLKLAMNVFGNKMVSNFKYALTPKQPSSFRLDLNDFDFSAASLIVNPKLLDDPLLQGRMSAHIQLDYLSTQSELARGEIQVSHYILSKEGFELKLIDPINVPIQLGYFQFPPTRVQFNDSELVLQGEGKKGDVDFKLGGEFDLAIAEFFTSSIQKITGVADADIRIYGPLKNLKLSGDINFSDTAIQMRWLQSPLEDVDGVIRLRQGDIILESLEAFLGDEVFSMNGKVLTFTDRFPELDLQTQFNNNKVKMAPLEVVEPRGTLFIKGKEPPYMISGNLEVNQAIWSRSFSSGGAGDGTRGDRFLPRDLDKQFVGGLFALDLNLNANQGFFVRNEILDAEFKGSAHMIGVPEAPKLVGKGQLVQGKVLFKDAPFILESTKVEFDDPNQLNPKFSASATTDVNQYKIRVIAFGRANSWKAEFSSTPFLPESDIFGILASGSVTTAGNTNRYQNKDRSYVSQGEAASLILHSMDFGKDVQSKTGIQFDIQEAVDNQNATSVFRPQNLSDNIAAPQLVLRRSLGKNVVLSFGSTVGVGSENQKEVKAEYKLTPNVSTLGVWNNTEATNSLNTRENRKSFGLDLKFNRRFK